MSPMLAFTLGFIAGAIVVGAMVIISDRWRPRRRPLFEPREKRLLLEVPFLSHAQLERIATITIGHVRPASALFWFREPQPDERMRLAVTLERFDPEARS